MTDWAPGTDLERRLAAAVAAGDVPGYVRLLTRAELLLPVDADAVLAGGPAGWATFAADGVTVLAAYTSGVAMTAATRGTFTTFRKQSLAELLAAWPDPTWRLGVDVNLPIGAILTTDEARTALTTPPAPPAAAPAGPPPDTGVPGPAQFAAADAEAGSERRRGSVDLAGSVMQKVLPPGQVGRYLENGYDLVAGYVHDLADVAHLRTAGEIVTGLALAYPGSAFTPDDEYVWVVRWRPVVTSVFRIPWGGTDPSHLAIWGDKGWVVEHPPFSGDGFVANPATPIPEWKVDSTRLTSGAELYRIDRHGTADLAAVYLSSTASWHRTAGGAS
ncbi:MAG TPA: hypothetical protein VGN37_23875 [Actinocatenispora sp.]